MEILVAFVVLAAAVGVLYRTFSAGLRNVDAISGYSEAISLAERRPSSVRRPMMVRSRSSRSKRCKGVASFCMAVSMGRSRRSVK